MQNKLINETSPYLLQHAANPVHWYPWCEEAFMRAREEDKPVFLSIGYSTCHWCHVMAHESFEDIEIAKVLNRYFISVKVDKEERPDIDSIYMEVCQAFTGSGGWPTTVFLTPEQKPFFAGTYFPKKAGYGQIGLKELLMALSDYLALPVKVTIAAENRQELDGLSCKLPLNAVIYAAERQEEAYPLKNGRTTFYVCKGHACQPPTNELDFFSSNGTY